MAKWLSKSDYVNKFLVHPAYLWLHKYDKDKLPGDKEADIARMEEGNQIELLARQLFSQGELIEQTFTEGVEQSRRVLKRVQEAGEGAVFQASILTERNLYARSDVMVPAGAAWDIYEIKGGTRVRNYHFDDLAFQKLAWEEAGYSFRDCYVVHLNSFYRLKDKLDIKKLFKVVKVTDQVAERAEITKQQVAEALDVLAQPSCPAYGLGGCRNLYGWMRIYRHLHPDLPSDHIFQLTRLSIKQAQALEEMGAQSISQIPTSFKLLPPQRAQVELAKLGKRSLDSGGIKRELEKLAFPLYFFDYETVSHAIPIYPGTKPFQDIAFQYSLHILPTPGGQLEHREFLAQKPGYPAVDLLQQLRQDIGPEGSIISWYANYESYINSGMAQLHPEYAEFLEDLNSRMYDLMEIFSRHFYAHPGFYGSSSIKKVLPVLQPEMSYADLAIGEGMTARLRWQQAQSGELSPEQQEQIYADLLTYCRQDTLAMVEIYQHLSDVVAGKISI